MASTAARNRTAAEKAPSMWAALKPLQDETAAEARGLPGPFIQFLTKAIDKSSPGFPLTPFIQGVLVATATLGKKRVLVFIRGGQLEKVFCRYMSNWQESLAQPGNAKTYLDACMGPEVIKEAIKVFKNSKAQQLRDIVSHHNQMANGSEDNIVSDSATSVMYTATKNNPRCNLWHMSTDECDTIVSRLEDGASQSEARYYLTTWDAGRPLTKNDSVTRCNAPFWMMNIHLYMQMQIKARLIMFETEAKSLGFVYRLTSLSYRKPDQDWKAPDDFDADMTYKKLAKRQKISLNPLKDKMVRLYSAIMICSSVFPKNAVDSNPATSVGVGTPSSAAQSNVGGPSQALSDTVELDPVQHFNAPIDGVNILVAVDDDVDGEEDDGDEAAHRMLLVTDATGQAAGASAAASSSSAKQFAPLPTMESIFGKGKLSIEPLKTDEQAKYDEARLCWTNEMTRAFSATGDSPLKMDEQVKYHETRLCYPNEMTCTFFGHR